MVALYCHYVTLDCNRSTSVDEPTLITFRECTMPTPLNFLFTTWEGGGNVTPALEAVRKLITKGHKVRVMSEECNRPESEAAGAAFTSWKRAPNRKDRTPKSQAYRDWDAPTPQEGLVSVIRDIWCGRALSYAQDVIEELHGNPVDLVVTSEMLFGVMAGCESIPQRFVTFAPNISVTPIPGIPPMGPGLPPARNQYERAIHAEIAKSTSKMFDAGLLSLNAARKELGLQPLAHVLDQIGVAHAELLGTAQAFDFPSDNLPGRTRYIGPQLCDPHWSNPWISPWLASDARPLVVVSFSTTFQNHVTVLQNVIDALAVLPVKVLVTLGGSIKQDDLRPAPNSILVDSAPHSIVMGQATLIITHGGHGTVMRGLLSRLPMLVIPHGRDQNDNAVRITERGAGLSLMPNASVDAIREACFRLLDDPSFSAAAKRLGDLVAAEAENSRLVPELEALASKKYHRELA